MKRSHSFQIMSTVTIIKKNGTCPLFEGLPLVPAKKNASGPWKGYPSTLTQPTAIWANWPNHLPYWADQLPHWQKTDSTLRFKYIFDRPPVHRRQSSQSRSSRRQGRTPLLRRHARVPQRSRSFSFLYLFHVNHLHGFFSKAHKKQAARPQKCQVYTFPQRQKRKKSQFQGKANPIWPKTN